MNMDDEHARDFMFRRGTTQLEFTNKLKSRGTLLGGRSVFRFSLLIVLYGSFFFI